MRPYECDRCEDTFDTFSAVKRHIIEVHEKRRALSLQSCQWREMQSTTSSIANACQKNTAPSHTANVHEKKERILNKTNVREENIALSMANEEKEKSLDHADGHEKNRTLNNINVHENKKITLNNINGHENKKITLSIDDVHEKKTTLKNADRKRTLKKTNVLEQNKALKMANEEKEDITVNRESYKIKHETLSEATMEKRKFASEVRFFSQKCNLQRHITGVHEKQKLYKCETCSGFFAKKSQLLFHKRTVHDGTKEHQCNICLNFFSQKCNLKRHISGVHEKNKKCTNVIFDQDLTPKKVN